MRPDDVEAMRTAKPGEIIKRGTSLFEVTEVIDGHVWGVSPQSAIKGEFCRICLMMRRRDKKNQPCKGPQELRM